MSDLEALMWILDKDPALRSDFTNVTILDRPPDPARLRRTMKGALGIMPRLARRVVPAPLRLAPPAWELDPTIDLGYHLRRAAVPPPGDYRTFLDLAAEFSSTPFDRSRPLWEFLTVDGLPGGRAALLQKVHHTITDGVGGMRLSLSMLDLERDPPPSGAPAADTDDGAAAGDDGDGSVTPSSPLGILGDAAGFVAGRPIEWARRGISTVGGAIAHPGELPHRASDAATLLASLRRQLIVTERARSPLMAPRSLGRRFETFSVPLADVKAAAGRLGATLNDVYVAGLAGALDRYHRDAGIALDDLRVAMPVNLRGGVDGTANHFAPARVLLPVDGHPPAERVTAIHERLGRARSEPILRAADSLAGLLMLAPTALLVSVTRAQARTVDFVASNLRGSPAELFIAGARIESIYAMGPRLGAALNVTMISYLGRLDMGLNIDPAAVTDTEGLLAALAESFDELIAARRPRPPHRRPSSGDVSHATRGRSATTGRPAGKAKPPAATKRASKAKQATQAE